MAFNVSCYSDIDGSEIFTRANGNAQQYQHYDMHYTNTTNTYFAEHGLNLRSSHFDSNKCIVFKKSHHLKFVIFFAGVSETRKGKVNDRAISASSELTPDELSLLCSDLCDLLYDAMALMCGSTMLQTDLRGAADSHAIDSLRRDIKVSFCLIDFLLDAFTQEPADTEPQDTTEYFRSRTCAVGQFGSLSECCSLLSDTPEQQLIDAFALNLRTKYAFLFRSTELAVVAGTREFISLPPVERILLCALVRSLPHAHMLDIPVYLPRTSPTTPYRFLALELVTNLYVGVLIGKDPFITDVIAQSVNFWTSVYPQLGCLNSSPVARGVLDLEALPFVLGNSKTLHAQFVKRLASLGDKLYALSLLDFASDCCVTLRNPQAPMRRATTAALRHALLRLRFTLRWKAKRETPTEQSSLTYPVCEIFSFASVRWFYVLLPSEDQKLTAADSSMPNIDRSTESEIANVSIAAESSVQYLVGVVSDSVPLSRIKETLC